MEDTEMEKEIIKTGCRIYDRVVRRDGVDDEGLGSIVLGHIQGCQRIST